MKIDQVDEKWSKKYKKSIDCSNPKGFSQKAHCAGRKKTEAFDNPYELDYDDEIEGFDQTMSVQLPDKTYLTITFNHEGNNQWVVEFYRANTQELTGQGDAQRIFATVIDAIQKFIKKEKPASIYFSADKMVEPGQNAQSRAKLYNSLVKRYASALGYDSKIDDQGDQVTYTLKRLQEKKKKKNESLILEWWEEWQQATNKFPQIGQYMKAYGYNAYSKDGPNGVRAFVKHNPEWINAMGKAYGRYANIGNTLANVYGASQGMSKDEVGAALDIRNQVKQKYPDAFKLLKKGDAMGALKAAGVTEQIAKWFVDRHMFLVNEMVRVDELKIEKPDSKDTKGIKRAEMPQVATKDYPEFIEYLRDNGAKFEKVTMPAKALKATQGEFSDAGVEKQLQKMQDGTPKKPVIASEDNYIIDGHHRWLVAWNTASSVEVFKVNMDADELLKLVKAFPKTTYKDIYTEELYDFDKDEPMKSTVAVPGYGTMSIEGLMKNLIQSAMELVDRMKQGTDGMRFADYQLNNNKVFLTKLSALIDALDGLQAIRKQGGARSRNIQKEQEEEQQELPIDTSAIFNYIQRLESGQNIQPQDADLMRRGVQSLTADRQTINPQAILQLLTILTG